MTTEPIVIPRSSARRWPRFAMLWVAVLALIVGAQLLAGASETEAHSSPQTVSETLTFYPDDDTYVREDKEDRNYGDAKSLRVEQQPRKDLLLKFAVAGIEDRPVFSATLRLYATNASDLRGEVYRVADDAWSEYSVTWRTAPEYDAFPIASLEEIRPGRWYETDVTSLLNGDGSLALRIVSRSNSDAHFASKEYEDGEFAPQLLIDFGPVPGISFSQSAGTTVVAEGGASDSYRVRLNTQPSATVSVAISGHPQLSVGPTLLIFTRANWFAFQTVSVAAVDDALIEGTHSATIHHTATGGGYSGVPIAGVPVTISDNDPSPSVTLTQSAGTTVVAEGGASDSYRVRLTAQPSGTVSIIVAGTSADQLTTVPAVLNFTPANWFAFQTVTVVAVDDALPEATRTIAIRHIVAGGGYTGVAIPDVVVTVIDNDPQTSAVSLPLPVGLSMVGWFGTSTTSGEILATHASILRILAWDPEAERWLSDDATLPSIMRNDIPIARGAAFFVVTEAPTELIVDDQETSPAHAADILPVAAGLSSVGWFGIPTTSGEILDANPSVQRIWVWDPEVQRWLSDDAAMPLALRTDIPIARGTAFYLVASVPTALIVPLT